MGQARLLLAREPIDRVLSDTATPEDLRARLVLVSQVRDFAAQQGLRVGQRYTQYAPWPGDRIVTTVVATRPGEVEPEGFWFPIVGRVPYKGYFDAQSAAAEAAALRGRGRDACIARVPAYSTLGWFDDPVTGPMLREPEDELVEMLFHELVHATVFVPGDAAWNEGVASFVGEEARVRFYAAHEGPAAAERERERIDRERRARDVLLRARRDAQRVYAALPPGPARDAARAEVDLEARAELEALAVLGGDAGLARLRTNDACLALAATYGDQTPCLAAQLRALDGDLPALVAELAAAATGAEPRRAPFAASACAADAAPESSAAR